jgi:2,3-bisphosphoglycerate-dependent phosphoglycerate mutase
MTMLFSSATAILPIIIAGSFHSSGTMMMIRALRVVSPIATPRSESCHGALAFLMRGEGPQEGGQGRHHFRWMTSALQSSSRDAVSSSSSSKSSNKNDVMKSRTDAAANTMTTLPAVPPHCHRVVLMRHGESEFNNANVFTGWCDIALTARGVVEAVEAGQVFASHKIHFRKCHSSVLTRAIVTAQRALEAAGVAHTPLQYDWRLNERHYGSLQGLSKERTAERLGRKRVMEWRRSYSARPPLMTNHHPHYEIIYGDPRYRKLQKRGGGAPRRPDTDDDPTSHQQQQQLLPLGESLEDCQRRVIEAWNDIVAEINAFDNNVGDHEEDDDNGYTLIVAHANSLRALVMHLDDIPSAEIENVNIPTAIPFFYDISVATGRPVVNGHHHQQQQGPAASSSSTGTFRGVYITDDRKKRSFLERRRAANDPFLWALDDHQVTKSMLLPGSSSSSKDDDGDRDMEEEEVVDMDGHEEEAKRNTELYSSVMDK